MTNIQRFVAVPALMGTMASASAAIGQAVFHAWWGALIGGMWLTVIVCLLLACLHYQDQRS